MYSLERLNVSDLLDVKTFEYPLQRNGLRCFELLIDFKSGAIQHGVQQTQTGSLYDGLLLHLLVLLFLLLLLVWCFTSTETVRLIRDGLLSQKAEKLYAGLGERRVLF